MVTIDIQPIHGPSGGADAEVVTWSGLSSADDDVPVYDRIDLGDRSIQFTGTFNGAQIELQGSNDGVTYFPLTTPTGLTIQFTAPGLAQQTEAVRYVKPVITSGSGANITAVMAARRTMRGG